MHAMQDLVIHDHITLQPITTNLFVLIYRDILVLAHEIGVSSFVSSIFILANTYILSSQ